MECPECGGETGYLRGELRRRPGMSWLQCRVCDWFGYRQSSKPTELKTLHRYEEREIICPWCGEDDYVYEVATPVTEHHGKPGRWINDFCLDCGRVGVWFRKEPATGAG